VPGSYPKKSAGDLISCEKRPEMIDVKIINNGIIFFIYNILEGLNIIFFDSLATTNKCLAASGFCVID
jgi:hypothetical protein